MQVTDKQRAVLRANAADLEGEDRELAEAICADLDLLSGLWNVVKCPTCGWAGYDQGGWFCHCTESKPGAAKERWFFGRWAVRVEKLRLR